MSGKVLAFGGMEFRCIAPRFWTARGWNVYGHLPKAGCPANWFAVPSDLRPPVLGPFRDRRRAMEAAAQWAQKDLVRRFHIERR